MKKALCEASGRVAQIVAVGQEFPVHPSVVWRDADDGVTEQYIWNGTQFVAPVPAAPPTIISYEAFQNRFTQAEQDATTEFVDEIKLADGKPKRPALKQALMRVTAKGTIDLTEARTNVFLQALVVGGVITTQRKTEILTP